MQGEIKKRGRNEEPIKQTHFLALEMISLKLARIICGDPNFADHWDDIAGYAELGKGKKHHVMTKRVCWRCGDAFLREENDKEPLCGQCAKNERDNEEREIVTDFLKQAIEKIDSSLNELKNKYPHLFQEEAGNSASSKPLYQCDTCKQDKTQNEIEYSCPSIEKWPLRSFICKDCAKEFIDKAKIHFHREGSSRPKEDYQVEESNRSCDRCGLETVCIAQYYPGSPFYCIGCVNEITDFVMNKGRVSHLKEMM